MIDPLILARGIHIAAMALASGSVCFVVLIADIPALRRRLNLMIWFALGVAILSGAAWLVLLAADLMDTPVLDTILNGGPWTVLTETRFGLIAGLRLALALALAALLLWAPARWLALVAAAGFVALLGLTGHAGATPGLAGRLLLASDLVHLLAASAWLG